MVPSSAIEPEVTAVSDGEPSQLDVPAKDSASKVRTAGHSVCFEVLILECG